MKATSIFISVVAAFCFAIPAVAVQLTEASKGDKRIRFVDYDPFNVVTIYGRVGNDTLVLFAKGEVIKDIGGGDTGAWGVGTTTTKNGFFIKPKVTSPNTNINIVTNKRVYSIDMKLAEKNQVNYFAVWYRYPEDTAAENKANTNRYLVRDLLSQTDSLQNNRKYTVQGSDALTPLEAWDDGLATYFRFSNRQRLPAFYLVDENNKEHLVNFTTRPDGVIVIHSLAKKFTLRSDDVVTCIFNDGFTLTGDRPRTNTISPKVERVIKIGDQ